MHINTDNDVTSTRWWDSDDPDAAKAPKPPKSPPPRRRTAYPLPDFEFPLRSPTTVPPSPCETTFSNTSNTARKEPDFPFLRRPGTAIRPTTAIPPSPSETTFRTAIRPSTAIPPSPSETAFSSSSNAAKFISSSLFGSATDIIPDNSFWATSAALLGKDFDFNCRTLVARVEAARSTRKDEYRNLNVFNDYSSAVDGSKTTTTIPPELIISLESLGMSWKWFTEEEHVRKYITNRIPVGEPWDFGVCLAHENGRLQCLVMHALGPARTYSEPTAVGGLQLDANMLISGTTPVFWWCRPHPQWSEANRGRWARAKKMDTQYAFAKRNIAIFNEKDNPNTRFALRQSRQDLIKDVELRERATGKYSVTTMNTILYLSEICELMDFLDEAERWNRELVARRTQRLGKNNEHTCAARYKHAQLLLKMGRYNDAKVVAVQNVGGMLDLAPSNLLVTKQNIQNCAIACKRRRLDQALEVVEHLWTLERWHPNDRSTKELGLEVLVEIHKLRHHFDRAEEYLRKQISLYDTTYGSKKKLGGLYFALASALCAQYKFEDGARELRKCTAVYKDLGLEPQDEEVIEANALLGHTLFGLKEWNKARHSLEKAFNGATLAFGSKHEKTLKAKAALEELDKAAKVKQGLAEKLVKHRGKAKAYKRI